MSRWACATENEIIKDETRETDVTNKTKYLNLTCVRAKRPERPKRVQQNKQYDLPQWLKQAKGGKLRKYHRSLFDYYLVFTSGTSNKDIFDNLVFAGGGWHLRFATTVALEYPRPPTTGIETKPPYFAILTSQCSVCKEIFLSFFICFLFLFQLADRRLVICPTL